MADYLTAILVIALLRPVMGQGAMEECRLWTYRSRSQPSLNATADFSVWNSGCCAQGRGCCHSQERWGFVSSLCQTGSQQSPINIQTRSRVTDSSLESFDLSAYDTRSNWKLENNGNTVEMVYEGRTPIIIKKGSLPADYELLQFHFHWGQVNNRGSEHTVDGVPSPLEMHIVHRCSSGALAVLSFLFEVVSSENPEFNEILNKFLNVTFKGESAKVEFFSLSSLLPRSGGNGRYYRYMGSLTTPPCTQGVIWSVFEEKIEISFQQLNRFRQLQAGVECENIQLVDNFRPSQNLFGRSVSYKPFATSSSDDD